MMTHNCFVIYQVGFGVIERRREEIDFGKKITFTVNHCDHVNHLTWSWSTGIQTDFEGIARVGTKKGPSPILMECYVLNFGYSQLRNIT